MSRLLQEAGAAIGRQKTRRMMASLAVERAAKDLSKQSQALAVYNVSLKKENRMERKALHDQVMKAHRHLEVCLALKHVTRLELDMARENFAKIEKRYTTTVLYDTEDSDESDDSDGNYKYSNDGGARGRWTKENKDDGTTAVSALRF